MARVARPEDLTLGLSLVALGALWTLANLGRIDLLETVRTWWPATLVVWGVLELAHSLTSRRG
jgi:LiaI-LiaF-like transmembrane region